MQVQLGQISKAISDIAAQIEENNSEENKYIEENNICCPLRFDVCEIIHKTSKSGEIVLSSINYIEGAFETQ